MFIAFAEGFAIFLLIRFAHIPVLFVIFSGLTFFGWGEIYSLFPPLAETCSEKFATTNYGLLYTAKGHRIIACPDGEFDCGQHWPLVSDLYVGDCV
jgi:OFA family oxalate/formate antiporter-like MFS transporter